MNHLLCAIPRFTFHLLCLNQLGKSIYEFFLTSGIKGSYGIVVLLTSRQHATLTQVNIKLTVLPRCTLIPY